jgi:tellurite resistance protein TehA-like permease
VAPPPPRPALGALFLVLGVGFAGIAAAAARAVGTRLGLLVVVIAAGVIALWFLTLAVRNLRRPQA